MNKTIIFLMLTINQLTYGQNLKVELPDRLDYIKYWNDNKKDYGSRDFNFDNLTKSNNEFWKNKIDLRHIGGKHQYQYWKHLTKTIKVIEEDIYERPYKKSDKIEYKKSYSFNSFGLITKKINSFNDGNSLVKEELKYNKDQNIVEYSKYQSNSYTNNKYRLDEKYIFKYNENQQLILEQEENGTTIFYTYNKKGLINKIEYFGYHPNQSGIIATSSNETEEEIETYKKQLRSTPLIIYSFKYDESNNRILEKKEDLVQSKIIYERIYEYNENKLLSKFIVDNYIFTYTYNDSNLLTEENLIDTKSSEFFTAINAYNNQGFLLKNTSPTSYGTTIYITEFKYDTNNNIIKEINSKMISRKKELYLFSIQEYDNNNYLTKCSSTSDYHAIESYTYDKLGRLLNYLREEPVNNKVFQNYTFKYDKNGGVIENFFNTTVKRKITYY